MPSPIDLTTIAAGIGGFVIHGQDAADRSGFSVASAGDINGDGFGDLIIGAPGGGAAANAKNSAGDSYVVFGKASNFGAAIDLATIAAGTGGFVIHGQDAGDRSGFSVASAGDINGDGFDDLIIGAYSGAAAGNAKGVAGDSYVIFGKASSFGAAIDLATIATGTGGFVIHGQDANDRSGMSVASAGDINGDGFGDLIIGAPQAGAAGNAKYWAGDSYVLFGKASSFGAAIDLATIATGIGGFVIHGQHAYGASGMSVASAGDINGDGFGDLIIGAPYANAAGIEEYETGHSYVVFGKASSFGAAIDLATIATGIGGFVIHGQHAYGASGMSVASAGDINGDGFGDLIVGAPYGDAAGNAKNSVGDSYVVFGKASNFGTAIDLATIAGGAGGFVIHGEDAYDRSGFSVASAGDINGDGFNDLIIGAYGADAAGDAKSYAGDSYVILGKASSFGAAIDLATIAAGTGGFVIHGQDARDFSGRSVASAGDVNGDGFDDLFIGAFSGDAADNLKSNAGDSYVIFGKSLMPPAVTANQIFNTEGGGVEAAGRIRVLADFSKAAYALQYWEVVGGNRFINDESLFSNAAYQELLTQGWQPVDLAPSPALASTSTSGGQTVTNSITMANGFFTHGNAAALVARSADALVISFRGTNDYGDFNSADPGNAIHPDKYDWFHMPDHYDLLKPLLTAVDQFVSADSNGITSVFVTGHSLGGSMVIEYMGTHPGANYFAVTYAAAGFALANYSDTARVTHIEINDDPVPDAGWHGGRTIHFEGSSDASFSSADNHSMDYYRQITQSVDSDSWTAILSQPGDPEVFIGAQIIGTSDFIVDGLWSGTNTVANAGNDTLTDPFVPDYNVYYGGRGMDVLTGGSDNEVFLGGADDDSISGGRGIDTLNGNDGNDTLVGGTGNDTLSGGAGTDTAIVSGLRSSYTIAKAVGSVTVSGADGIDVLTGVEKLSFDDATLNLAKPAVSDFNADSNSDLLWFRQSDGYAYLWTLTNNVQSGGNALGQIGAAWTIQTTGDFNGDGSSDFVWKNTTTGQFYIWNFTNGIQSGGANIGNIGTNWNVMGSGDFNADGTGDVVWRDSNTGQLYLWMMQNNAIASSTNLGAIGVDWTVQAVGDFNGDGTSDLALRNTATGQAYLWNFTNGALNGGNNLGIVPTNWTIMGSGDFNADGTDDLAWRNGSNGNLNLWMMQNNSISSTSDLGTIGAQWTIDAISDVNADGTSDLLLKNSSSGQFYIWDITNGVVSGGADLGLIGADWQLV